jgi:hypothetical protein
MNYFALFLFAFTTISVTAKPPTVRHYKSSREAFKGPDRTINWERGIRVRRVISASAKETAILVGKCGNITWPLSCTRHPPEKSNCP